MPSPKEKQKHKSIRRQLAQEAKSKANQQRPISLEHLHGLFDFLDSQFEHQPCDHSLRITREFLVAQGLDPDKITPWLGEYGGFCDCEVLANVEEHWPSRLGRRDAFEQS
jgi:hypothetical protein